MRALFAIAAVSFMGAAPAFATAPTVVVYPFTAGTSGINNKTFDDIADQLATRIARGGVVKVKLPTPGVTRQTFLKDARSLHADYYVSGFITQLGRSASVLEQVASTKSGTIVFSATAEVSDNTDVAAQGDVLRESILARSNRGIHAFEEQPLSAPPPQAAKANRK